MPADSDDIMNAASALLKPATVTAHPKALSCPLCLLPLSSLPSIPAPPPAFGTPQRPSTWCHDQHSFAFALSARRKDSYLLTPRRAPQVSASYTVMLQHCRKASAAAAAAPADKPVDTPPRPPAGAVAVSACLKGLGCKRSGCVYTHPEGWVRERTALARME